MSADEYHEAELIVDPDYVLLQREYGGNLRRFFREQMDTVRSEPTLDFLSQYDQPNLECNGQPCERLSIGSNSRGDIFCIMSGEDNYEMVVGVWHNIFSGATRSIDLTEETATLTDTDIAYRNKGGNIQKRQFISTLDEERRVRFVLSGQGNRCEELDEFGVASNTLQEQLLSDCRMLRHEITYDSHRTQRLSRHAITAVL